MALSQSEVIDSQPFVATRCLLESLHIQCHSETLNRGKGTLPEVYTSFSITSESLTVSFYLLVLTNIDNILQ